MGAALHSPICIVLALAVKRMYLFLALLYFKVRFYNTCCLQFHKASYLKHNLYCPEAKLVVKLVAKLLFG